MVTKIVFLLSFILVCGCFPKHESSLPPADLVSEDKVLGPNDSNYFESDQGFPMDETTELQRLALINKEECLSNLTCSMNQVERLTDEFQFKTGQLILRGNLFNFNRTTNRWSTSDKIEVTTFAANPDLINTVQESDYHNYISEVRPYTRLLDNLNKNLASPLKPIVVTQGKLGLLELSYQDPGLCDMFAAERFYLSPGFPWPMYQPPSEGVDNFDWAPRTGFDENNDVFAAETLIICGEITILNRTVKLEAKNIIFYNSHIRVMSDRDMPSGLRVITENLGYFGTNLIESNIINRVSGQKNSTAPTIDLGATGLVTKLLSDVPINNNQNTHYFKIFMAEKIEN